MIVVSGTGRLADLITAMALTEHQNFDSSVPDVSVDEAEVKSLVSQYLPSGQLLFIDLNTSLSEIKDFIRSFFELQT